MSDSDKKVFEQAFNYATEWCQKHQWQIGVAEMALGAAAISWGIQHGTIQMGRDFVISSFSTDKQLYAKIGSMTGKVASVIIDAISVTASGQIAIPIIILSKGASAILEDAGYNLGERIYDYLNPPVNPMELFKNCCVMAIGVALLIDGARRTRHDKKFQNGISFVKDGAIHLSQKTATVVASNMIEFGNYITSNATIVGSNTLDKTIIARDFFTYNAIGLGSCVKNNAITMGDCIANATSEIWIRFRNTLD